MEHLSPQRRDGTDQDSACGSSGWIGLARVFGKLLAKTLLRVRNPFQGGYGNAELAVAKSADSNGGNCAKPFEDPEIAFGQGAGVLLNAIH